MLDNNLSAFYINLVSDMRLFDIVFIALYQRYVDM